MPGPDEQARLAEALRANLHRRKAQARARTDGSLQPIAVDRPASTDRPVDPDRPSPTK